MKLSLTNKNALVLLALLAATGECFVVNNNPMVGTKQSISWSTSASPTSRALGGSRVRRFATTVMPPENCDSNTNDQVQRLQEMAKQLRQEAAGLEAEQKSAIAAAAAKVFSKFDTDHNGEISVPELKQGLEKLFKMELPEKRADQLLNKFDINGDGVLQVEEFVGVNQFRNQLDALVRQERDLARQETKNAAAQAQAEQLRQAQIELVNDQPPTTSDKLVSVLPYLFPLLDGLQFARFFVEGHQDNPVAVAATVAYALYRSIPFGGFLSFLALTVLSENPQINRLVRFNMQQAVFLDIALFVPTLIAVAGAGLLTATGVSLPAAVAELGSDAVFVALLAAVSYSAVTSLTTGQAPNKLPFISQRVEDRMISPEMFDAEGRFAPFDEDGNLKKPSNNDKS